MLISKALIVLRCLWWADGRLVPLPAAIPSSDETGRYARISPVAILTGSVSLRASRIRQYSADYAAPRAIRASRHERVSSEGKIFLLKLNIFVSVTGFDYLKPGRRGCAILIFSLSYFFVMFWKIHYMYNLKKLWEVKNNIILPVPRLKKQSEKKWYLIYLLKHWLPVAPGHQQ